MIGDNLFSVDVSNQENEYVSKEPRLKTRSEARLSASILLFEKFVKEDIEDIDLYPYQVKPARTIIKDVFLNLGSEIVMLFCRQSGKTEMIADVVDFLAVKFPSFAQACPELKYFKKGIKIGIFAPKQEQSKITFDRLKERFDKNLMKEKYVLDVEESNGNTFKLSNGAKIRCITASEGTTIAGETFDVIIIEECQDVSERKLKSDIFPMGAATNATKVLIGTAGYKVCYFYKASLRTKGSKYGFFLDRHEAVKHNEKYRKYIEGEKIRIGEESDEFKAMYDLTWILERGMFVTQEQLEPLMSDIEIDYEKPVVAGIDWGKLNDSTVVTIMSLEGEILDWLELRGDDYSSQLDYIGSFLKPYKNLVMVKCDATATQDQINDNLKQRVLKKLNRRFAVLDISYVFTPSNKDMMYKNLAQFISEKKIKIPKKDSKERRKFMQQMLELEKEYKGNYLSCHHPDVKDAHDDYCDSVALACVALLQSTNIVNLALATSKNPIIESEKVDAITRIVGLKSEPFFGQENIKNIKFEIDAFDRKGEPKENQPHHPKRFVKNPKLSPTVNY